MTARFIVADVFDGLAQLEDGSIDLVITSPPFLALRSYLPADHPDKAKEIGSEATPAEFLDTLLAVTAELRRVLAPHGSIAVELGDTYAGSGGAGGDYGDAGWREGQLTYKQQKAIEPKTQRGPRLQDRRHNAVTGNKNRDKRPGWPLDKSVCMIPEAYRFALAYGFNPFTGAPSPAGKWRVRNKVTWCRPNPPVGALGDKWRPATSDVVVACVSGKRYWDDMATRKAVSDWEQKYAATHGNPGTRKNGENPDRGDTGGRQGYVKPPSGAPLLDYWEIPPGGYQGAHYAVFPPALVEPLVKAMGPQKVCLTCGEPSRRVLEQTEDYAEYRRSKQNGEYTVTDFDAHVGNRSQGLDGSAGKDAAARGQKWHDRGWSDCGCSGGHCSGDYPCDEHWRNGIVLDPFAGSGTTLAVATGHGLDAIGIDLDSRNADLTTERVGPFLMEFS